jgi:hypothetical protein
VAADVPGRSAFSVSLAVEPRGALGLAFVAVDDRPAETQVGPGVVTYDAYAARSTNGGASFTPPLRVSTVSSDPDGSSSNSLQAQFIGDYISAVADSRGGRLYVDWTDSRNASACADVDSFRVGGTTAPDVLTACPLTFGNTDIFLGTVSY